MSETNTAALTAVETDIAALKGQVGIAIAFIGTLQANLAAAIAAGQAGESPTDLVTRLQAIDVDTKAATSQLAAADAAPAAPAPVVNTGTTTTGAASVALTG